MQTSDQNISNKVSVINQGLKSSAEAFQYAIQGVLELQKGEKEGALQMLRALMDIPQSIMQTSREATQQAIKLLEELTHGRKEVTEKSQSFHLRG